MENYDFEIDYSLKFQYHQVNKQYFPNLFFQTKKSKRFEFVIERIQI